MIEMEVRKLKRTQLIEMVLEQTKTMEVLREELEIANGKVSDKNIAMEDVGNIAEAALKIHNVFEDAQAAAQQYLTNVQKKCAERETVCAEMEREITEKCKKLELDTKARCEKLEFETTEKCKKLELETTEKCEKLESETRAKCEAMEIEAERGVETRWSELSSRLEKFYQDHQDLQKLLNATKE